MIFISNYIMVTGGPQGGCDEESVGAAMRCMLSPGKRMNELFRRPESLLRRSPAFLALDREAQRKLADDTATIAALLGAEPAARAGKGVRAALKRGPKRGDVDLPDFVRALLEGTFEAVVDASVEQMRAYAELVASVASTSADSREKPGVVAARLEHDLRRIFVRVDLDPSAEHA